jgi:hypothetical protein
MRRSHLVALATVAACVKSAATPCGDDLCPVGLACMSDHCVDPALITSCAGRAENDQCNPGNGSGFCQGGICIVGYCGDGVINGIEECDGNALGSATCLQFGAPQPGGLACGSNCKLDPSGCSEYCGNGIVDSNEQCDGSNFANKSCIDYGFYGGTLACTSTCMINLGGCAGQCGNGVIDGLNELCDGSDLNNQTCTTLGYKGSGMLPLTCGSDCTFAPSSCTCGGALCASNQTCEVDGSISNCVP